MIIDDDVEYLQEMQELLQHEGYTVNVLSSSNVSLEAAKRLTPEVIILDLNMGGKSGQEVAQALRADQVTRQIKLIVVSGHCSMEESNYLKKAFNVLQVITKPADPGVLVTLLKSVTSETDRDRFSKDPG